jgi:hypothetical protein
MTSYEQNALRIHGKPFLNKVKQISNALQIQYTWLLAVMWSESQMNPQAINPAGGATGLIQFMPATAQGLGTSTNALYNMNALEQLDYVYQYFKSYTGRIKEPFDLYLVTFYPYAIGKPDTYVLGSEQGQGYASIVANVNQIFDVNKDLRIAKGEFRNYVNQKTFAELPTGSKVSSPFYTTWWFWLLILGVLGVVAYLLRKNVVYFAKETAEAVKL